METRALLASLLDLLMPRSCVLCGEPIPPGSSLEGGSLALSPVCRHCAAGLRPFDGPRCPRCGLPLISEEGLCMRCRKSSLAFDSAYPLFSYSGVMRDLIFAYKKERRRSLAPFFADLLEGPIREKWPDFIIVPVPPRPGKLRRQGWDQVEEIARILESRGLPLRRPLERRPSGEQKKLGLADRSENARKAYGLRRGERSPEFALLVDDVATTCATLGACAAALRSGGASRVEAIVIAAD
jgi:Predicted amidophosphoribosyltransferases